MDSIVVSAHIQGVGVEQVRTGAFQARVAAGASVIPMETNKLKVLCLHGYLQNAQVFRSKIGSWRKGLKSKIDFVFVDAPYVMFDADNEEAKAAGGRAGGRSWWLWKDLEETPRPMRSALCSGHEASMGVISKALEEHWPVDGLMGFSQGAVSIALYLASIQLELIHGRIPDFVILVSGGLPRDPSLTELVLSGAPAVPSLHLFGEKDTLVEPVNSQRLMSSFSSKIRTSYQHEGGHMVPTCTGMIKKEILSFLNSLEESSKCQTNSDV